MPTSEPRPAFSPMWAAVGGSGARSSPRAEASIRSFLADDRPSSRPTAEPRTHRADVGRFARATDPGNVSLQHSFSFGSTPTPATPRGTILVG
jgi:hypothetical protein